MLWELEEAEKALYEGDVALAKRYLSKAKEYVQCVYCHKHARIGIPGVSPHFKGCVHDACKEKYSGRGDYIRQHPESQEDWLRWPTTHS